jgi:DNA-binding NarL/FixJ family response regulator
MTRKTADPSRASLNITCVVADQHPTLRQALARILDERGIEVVQEAADGAEALAAIEELRPAVAILDAEMPQLSAVEVIRRAGASRPAVIVYSSAGHRGGLVEALNAGARGFLLKEAAVDELIKAVTTVAGGDVYVDPALGEGEARTVPAPPARRSTLSAREQDILGLLASGMTTKEIAGALFISPETVRTYVRRAMEKLEARTRTQAVAIAVRRSLIS